jgi:hypothetical protein
MYNFFFQNLKFRVNFDFIHLVVHSCVIEMSAKIEK